MHLVVGAKLPKFFTQKKLTWKKVTGMKPTSNNQQESEYIRRKSKHFLNQKEIDEDVINKKGTMYNKSLNTYSTNALLVKAH